MSRRKAIVEYYYPLSCVDNLGKSNKDVSFLLAETKKYPSIRNIGVIGPYGSGKSSVVHSFIKIKDRKYKHTLFFSQETLAEHLVEKEPGSSQPNQGTKQPSGDLFKKAIYLELLKYDTKSILLNKYLNSIVHLKGFGIIRFAVYCLLCLGISFSLFWILHSFLDKELIFSISISVTALLLFLSAYLFFYVHSLSVAIGLNSSIAKGELQSRNNPESIYQDIEKHPTKLDNLILYILQNNHIKYFVIEDLERLNDNNNILYHNDKIKAIDVIKHFKMLSDLINRSKIVKKKITFIYGLNEECFTNSEIRSKFFDLIVPVIPVSTYASAAQSILDNPTISKLVEESKIKKSTINKISLYFINQRQINSLLSQFYLSHNKLSSSFDRNELFAICSLMVLFPEFSHKLFHKNNDLDLLINNQWHINEDGKGVFESKKMVFPETIRGRLLLFLSLCFNNSLITRGYRYCLTVHTIADDKILSPNDLDLLISSNSGIDIRNKEFDNPQAVLDREENESLYSDIKSIHPQIISCLLKSGEKDKLNAFKEALDLADGKISTAILSSIIEYASDDVIEKLCRLIIDKTIFTDTISSISNSKKHLVACYILKIFSSNFLNNQENQLKDFYSIINGESFSKTYPIDSRILEKVLTSVNYHPENIQPLCDCDSKSIQLFKNSLKFELSKNNLCTIFPEFSRKPFGVLHLNQELNKKVLHEINKFVSIIELCDNHDEQSSVISFVRKNYTIEGVSSALTSKYFSNWKFKILTEHSTRVSPLPGAAMLLLLDANLLDLNSAYENYYAANDPTRFDKYLIDHTGLISSSNYKLSLSLTLRLINLLGVDKLPHVINCLSSEIKSDAIGSIEQAKLVVLFAIFEVSVKKDVLSILLSSDEKKVQDMLSNESVDPELLSGVTLSKDLWSYVFDNNLRKYYPVLISKADYNTLVDIIENNDSGRSDFAKLIFNEDGSLVNNVYSKSLVKICIEEIDNKGCLLKVFEQGDDSVFRDEGWSLFIKAYVEKHGHTDSFGKSSISKDDLGEAMIAKLNSVSITSTSKGNGKNKIYFRINDKNQ